MDKHACTYVIDLHATCFCCINIIAEKKYYVTISSPVYYTNYTPSYSSREISIFLHLTGKYLVMSVQKISSQNENESDIQVFCLKQHVKTRSFIVRDKNKPFKLVISKIKPINVG